LTDTITRKYAGEGFRLICGVDEAGRGPLAGPVCAAAVILPHGAVPPGIDDSKKLAEKKRDELYGFITKTAAAYAVAFSSEAEIDSENILNAALSAMRRAVLGLAAAPDIILVDGNKIPPGLPRRAEAVVGGDRKCVSIAAASVLAKVTRDRLMAEYDKEYPFYGFARHKGYGTKEHIAAIGKRGLCAIHRKTFIKAKWLLGEENQPG
jgi:ribonuclease HII